MTTQRAAFIVVHARGLLRVLITGVALCAIGSVPAYAQGAADARVTSGLFSGGNKPVTSRQHFDFIFDSSETFDTDVPSTVAPTLTPDSPQSGGYSTLLKAATNYNRQGNRTRIEATASSAVRYYASLDEARVVGSTAALGLTSRLSRSTELLLNQRFAYSPSYLYQLIPTAASQESGALPIAAPDYNIGEFRSSAYGTTMTISHAAFAGGRFDATGAYNKSDFRNSDAERPDSTVYTLEGRYSRRLSKATELSVGYSHRNGDFGYGAWTTEHGVPVGITYSRALSSTRRAELRFTLMPQRVDIPDSAPDLARSGRLYRIAADASFSYPLYRTWFTSVEASRRIEYLVSLPQPVFSNRVQARVEGFVTTRTHVSLSVAYSDDQSVLASRPFYIEMYAGDALVRYALGKKVGVYGGYVFYRHDPRGDTETLRDIPSRLARNGARVGLILFVPVMGR